MRILVTGSRDWTDRDAIYRALNAACVEFDLNHEPDEYGNTMPDPSKVTIVEGGARGADAIARDWCYSADFMPETHKADWDLYKRRAGIIRNAEMVNSGIDLCLAFIKNRSKGATHCAYVAERKGIPVRRFEEN